MPAWARWAEERPAGPAPAVVAEEFGPAEEQALDGPNACATCPTTRIHARLVLALREAGAPMKWRSR
jgi:hypothetical protein